ncbi:MAG: hypothetical protein AMS15_04765 [Planctomycetes bacterium DG_23]|nr:MAG: hypothetical protein AMS15_04765 [Planctomycetes bacterium DG_23]
MSYAYLVIYEGRCENPDLFLDYYVSEHLPIVWTFPKIRRVEVHRNVESKNFFMMTRLTFATLEDLRAALESPQREKAKADMAKFPAFRGEVRRHTVEILDVVRKKL